MLPPDGRSASGPRRTSPISDRALPWTRPLTVWWPLGKLRRIARGLYDVPSTNRLTGKPTSPDPRAVIDTLARKNNVRVLVDGITAANDLGLTNAVPARITVLTDARLRPVSLGKLVINFCHAAPSRRRSTGCATCSPRTTDSCGVAFSPSFETRSMGRRFVMTSVPIFPRFRSGCARSYATCFTSCNENDSRRRLHLDQRE